MTERRGTTTDQLASIIQVIQMGRKSGTLTVERGEHLNLEEGAIIFVQGKITEAHIGHRTNQVALEWFKTWKACRFTFVPATSARPTGPMPAMPAETPRVALRETNPHLSTPPERSTGPLQETSPLPRRTLPTEEALRLVELGGLSRVHRRLLLLIDGRRTMQELVRLMGRSPEDVQKLLHDLAYIHVVQ